MAALPGIREETSENIARETAMGNFEQIDSILTRINRNGPNAVYDNAQKIIPTLSKRDTRRGWFGPKQSVASYAKYMKDTLKKKQLSLISINTNLDTRNPYLQTLRSLLDQPKQSASAIFKAFDSWRKTINPASVNRTLFDSINKVSSPGWFGVSKGYIPTIQRLVKQYDENKAEYIPVPQGLTRVNTVLGRRGYNVSPTLPKAQTPSSKHECDTDDVFDPSIHLADQNGKPVCVDNKDDGRQRFIKRFLAGGAYDTRKIATFHRMARKHRHTAHCGHRRTHRNQHGGATPMPLAYYQPGAYETRTLEPTGAGIAGSNNSWIRAPVAQTGGRRRTHKRQAGGFSPSVMGQFASAGLRLLPVAGYMGYKMFGKGKKSRKAGRRTRRR